MLYVYIENGDIIATESLESIPQNATYKQFNNLTLDDVDLLKVIYDSTTNTYDIQIKTEAELLNEKKEEFIEELEEVTKNYIEEYYPDIKQRSDIADKEYQGTQLLTNSSQIYSAEQIYKMAYISAAKILQNLSTLDQELVNYDTTEQLAWSQLIKIAIRIGFVQEVKQEFRNKVNSILTAANITELEALYPNLFSFTSKLII